MGRAFAKESYGHFSIFINGYCMFRETFLPKLLFYIIVLQLHKRTFHARSSHLTSQGSVARPPVYKSWTEDSLKRAYTAVKENRMSIRKASVVYNVPRSTLADRVSGRAKFGCHSGPSRYLSDQEEKELAGFLAGAARMGYARSKREVLGMVEKIVHLKGIEAEVSNGWWESFQKRHPLLTLRSAEKLSYARLVATDPYVIKNYFDLLRVTLDEYNLFDSPSQLFNCDESGMPLDHTPPAVIAIKGQKHPRVATAGNKKQISVLVCCNAAGNFIPPLVIFRRKALNNGLIEGEIPGTMYGLSDRGWMDAELFYNWFKYHFLKHAPAVRPLLLLLDGHSSHYHPGFIELAAQHRVIVFCLPPNTTHLMQPLDKGVFGPLKAHWHHVCQRYMRENPGQIVTEYSFSKLFKEAWCKSMTVGNAMGAFRTTGIYPFDPTAVKASDENESDLGFKSSGLPFIPLISPARPKMPHHVRSLTSTSYLQTSESSDSATNDDGRTIIFECIALT